LQAIRRVHQSSPLTRVKKFHLGGHISAFSGYLLLTGGSQFRSRQQCCSACLQVRASAALGLGVLLPTGH
jgi:hypothetical protein